MNEFPDVVMRHDLVKLLRELTDAAKGVEAQTLLATAIRRTLRLPSISIAKNANQAAVTLLDAHGNRVLTRATSKI